MNFDRDESSSLALRCKSSPSRRVLGKYGSVKDSEMFVPTVYLAKGCWNLVHEFFLGISSLVFEPSVGLMSDWTSDLDTNAKTLEIFGPTCWKNFGVTGR